MLLDRIRRGDESALTGLVDRHYVALSRLALLYLGPQAEAYEAVQALLRELPRRTRALERAGDPRRGLYGLLLGELRSRALAAGAIASTPADRRTRRKVVELERHAGEPSKPFDEILEHLDAGEIEELAREVISALPLDQREVVILRDVERWPAEDVVRVLGRREPEQRRLLNRARSCVRRVLEAYAEAAEQPQAA
jgi:RNA polymerase sigma-70 factor (ECF subfamily)